MKYNFTPKFSSLSESTADNIKSSDDLVRWRIHTMEPDFEMYIPQGITMLMNDSAHLPEFIVNSDAPLEQKAFLIVAYTTIVGQDQDLSDSHVWGEYLK